MAEGPRMTAAQLTDKLLASQHADVLRESVAWMVAELMEAEVAALQLALPECPHLGVQPAAQP